MPNRPLLLLTFANQLDGYLPNLKAESAAINAVLAPLHDKQTIEVYREESATATTVYDALMRFRDRIAIFHYAGHADGQRLYLEDNAGDAGGVATLLGQLPNLQVVFLNGCATLPQVENLFNNGVRAIIATAVPIDDQRAKEFSTKFYQALATGCDLRTAFQSAVAFIQLRYGGDFAATIVKRGEYAQFGDTQRMPWGLFLNTQHDINAVLSWKLPTQIAPVVNRPNTVDYVVNSYLIEVIDAMLDADPQLTASVTDANGDPKDDREIFSVIIENFPWMIGVQLRLLATKDDNLDTPSIERLKQLVSTYTVSVQFLYYAVLSQLWDAKRNENFAVAPVHANLMYLTQADFNYFDYQANLIDAAQTLNKAGVPLFIKELGTFVNDLQNTQHDLSSAAQHLASLRLRINAGDWAELEANKYQACADAEYSLTIFLSELAFLVNYDLITIRDIQVVNFRHTEPKFNHYIGRLNAKVTDLTVGRNPKPRTFTQFTNNASVVLTPNIQDPSTYLNLSPFIIDKNAFGVGMTEERATEQQLFVYAFRENDEYKYFSTIHNIYKVQERLTDQFLTSEGAPASSSETQDDPRASRFRSKLINRIKRSANNEVAEEEIQSPFAILKTQFQAFTQDLNTPA